MGCRIEKWRFLGGHHLTAIYSNKTIKMTTKRLLFHCCAIWLLSIVNGDERSIFSSVWNRNPTVAEAAVKNEWIGPDKIEDGCERQYPSTPDNEQTLSLAYKRYLMVPQIFPAAPTEYAEV